MTLDPVRGALLDGARSEVASVIAAARADAAQRLDAAREEAAELLEAARAAGAAEAAAQLRRSTTEARRAARAQVLDARRQAYDEARQAVREAALEMRGAPGYPAMLERWREAVAARLGDGAVVDVDPAGAGGVIGRRGALTLDCTLTTVADRCADSMGEVFEALWT